MPCDTPCCVTERKLQFRIEFITLSFAYPNAATEEEEKEKQMKKVLFVCNGNICRSPMAEFYFRHLAEVAGLGNQFVVASAGVNPREVGQPVYALAKRQLAGRGIGCKGKLSQLITPAMYHKYDYVVAMDKATVGQISKLVGRSVATHTTRLLDYVPAEQADFAGRDVLDPWHTRKFETAWEDIRVGCEALMEQLSAGMTPMAADEETPDDEPAE